MTISWLKQVSSYLATGRALCRIVIADAKGSTPREMGADMLVLSDHMIGTIGGGRLEFEAISIARGLIEQAASDSHHGFARHWQKFALGPSLGQCCGGSVMLLFEAYAPMSADAVAALAEAAPAFYFHGADDRTLPQALSRRPDDRPENSQYGYDPVARTFHQSVTPPPRSLYLYGAGHVGRAVMAITGQLGFNRVWVDDAATRFPANVSDMLPDITIVPAADMTVVARRAPADSYHLVMSYSHRLDEAIVHAILDENQFARLGLIGSATKRQRFAKSLIAAGVSPSLLARLTCPIGLDTVKGKAPERVALSIAAQLAVWLDADE